MQLLQDRASVTASFAGRKPDGSLNIHRVEPLDRVSRCLGLLSDVVLPDNVTSDQIQNRVKPGRDGGRYRIRTYDFHRVKMALYR